MDLTRPFSPVTPTLDGDVLARLAAADDASFTTGDLHRLIPNASIEGIRRVLRRLVAQGIVEAHPAGRATLYRLNREHVAAEPIIALARLRQTMFERLRAAVAEWHPRVPFAAVFGSWARGEATADSDLDLFVLRPSGYDDDAWQDGIDQLAAKATRWTGNDARAVVVEQATVVDHRHDPLLESVLRDGVPIAGTTASLRRLLRDARAGA